MLKAELNTVVVKRDSPRDLLRPPNVDASEEQENRPCD